MRISQTAAAIALVLCLVSGAMADGAVKKYYKYKVDDVNWLPVFKSEMQRLSDNNGTGYAVTFNDKGQYVAVEHSMRGRVVSDNVYVHGDGGKLVEKMHYAVVGGERSLEKKSAYEWKGDALDAVHYFTADGKPLYDWRYEKSWGDVSFVQYFPDGSEGESYTTSEEEDGIITEYKWKLSNKKYYLRTIDPATGQIVGSRGYIKGKLDHKQAYRYNDEGVIQARDSFDAKGRQYCWNVFDGMGNRIESSYHYRDNRREKYQWTLDKNGRMRQLAVTLNGKPAYTVKYIRLDSGDVKMSEVYDSRGELFARYPNHAVQYLKKDGSSESGYKGTVLKSGKLW